MSSWVLNSWDFLKAKKTHFKSHDAMKSNMSSSMTKVFFKLKYISASNFMLIELNV